METLPHDGEVRPDASLNRSFNDMFEVMTQDLQDFVNDAHELVGLGEPTHKEPAFARIRNELFARLAARGFRSIALETDRLTALAVNDFVQAGAGTLDAAMSEGFTHGFGAFAANRELVAWMREYNEGREPEERLAFYGIDAPLEFSAPSPRRFLEHARDYLGLDLDLVPLVGDDERWGRMEAVMDPAESPGDSPEAAKLRAIADDMLTSLYVRAPELIGATSRDTWERARINVLSGLGVLRYHAQAARGLEDGERWSRMSAVRDALMAQTLIDIRGIEARRGPTLVCGHNLHLRRNPSRMGMGPLDLVWSGAGAVMASLLGERYTCMLGSLGSSKGIGLESPDPATFEGALQRRFDTWGLTSAASIEPAIARTDAVPEQGYFPLETATLEGADTILHVNEGSATPNVWVVDPD